MLSQKIRDKGYLVFPLVFLVVSFIWYKLTNATWDDDAATRYFGTLDAGYNPYHFLDSWTRPLFVTLFYLPIHFFGRLGLVVCMSLLTASSGVLLYKGLKHKGIDNAYAVIFFLIFQTFLFGISRDAMTEPLASFILSLGLYFYFTDKLGWFAVVGSFLPLARTETVLLMPFWGFLLLHRKKYKFIPLLGVGILLWYIGWVVYSGNLHAFFDDIFKSGGSPNRYERTKITHHFGKLVYVVGPIIFIYFLLGYITSIKKMFSDYFIMLQFTAGFIMYGVFSSSSISLGQSGGALRNLVTLSPLISIIALYGFNYWMGIFTSNKPIAKPVPVPEPVSNTAKKNQKKIEPKKVEEKDGTGFRKIMIFLFLFFLLLLSTQLLTDKLMTRQFFSPDETDYTIITFLIVGSLLILLSFIKVFNNRTAIIIVPLFLLQTAFTLSYEKPDSHSNDERKTLNTTVAWLKATKLDSKKTYCNNLWFYWTSEAKKYPDSVRYGRIDSVTLSTMPEGSIVVWEPHYTNKNYTNIPVDMLLKDTSMNLIYYVKDDEKNLRVMVFTKMASKTEVANLFESLAKQSPNDPYVMYLKGYFEKTRLQNLDMSTKSFTRAIELDATYSEALVERGLNYLMMNDKMHACADLKSANTLGNPDASKYIPQACN